MEQNQSPKTQLPPIPAKRYFTIGEVSELCGVKPHVLRYWEQEFTQLKPVKRRGNRRYYQHHEVLLIRRIRDLLYDQGFTISGARNRLDDGAAAVPRAAREAPETPPPKPPAGSTWRIPARCDRQSARLSAHRMIRPAFRRCTNAKRTARFAGHCRAASTSASISWTLGRAGRQASLLSCDDSGFERRYSFADMAGMSDRAPAALASRGVRKGTDASSCSSPAAMAIAMLRCLKLGAIPIPCIDMLTQRTSPSVRRTRARSQRSRRARAPKFNACPACGYGSLGGQGWEDFDRSRRVGCALDAAEIGIDAGGDVLHLGFHRHPG